ncbi:enoyl-CoA hydratase [Modestobacter sp. DSM 44400]|uniref:hypothetical protein n=1 Tax=Modestobacter sp. DSM 44400 TaxID=1550230 RepID=UPI000899E0DF|nr:hypothetical protein [Modestobacter sp. DSM 44400]SDY54015.1 enoyl-CoA hydratase [Modestobacter sp. DSM 44400]
MDDAAVEDRALELAGRVAKDPELARATVGNFRKELGPPHVSWRSPPSSNGPPQMWSMRRSAE